MAFELHGKEREGLVPRTGMPGNEVKGITRQLLGALRTLHGEGFAHSDIKPENVLYDPESGVAKLIDMSTADRKFGVGRGWRRGSSRHRKSSSEWMNSGPQWISGRSRVRFSMC